MKLVINMLFGTMLAGLAETLALGEKVGLQQEQILEILSLLPTSSKLNLAKGDGLFTAFICSSLYLHYLAAVFCMRCFEYTCIIMTFNFLLFFPPKLIVNFHFGDSIMVRVELVVARGALSNEHKDDRTDGGGCTGN